MNSNSFASEEQHAGGRHTQKVQLQPYFDTTRSRGADEKVQQAAGRLCSVELPMPKRLGRRNPLANAGKLQPEPEPEPEPEPAPPPPARQASEFKAATVNVAEKNRRKAGPLDTRRIDPAASGKRSARAAKTLDVRKQKKTYWFVYEKRRLDWYKSEHHVGSSKKRKGRIQVSDIEAVWADAEKKNFRFQIKAKGEEEGTYQFYAPTRQDQREWVQMVDEAFQAYQAELSKKHGRKELQQIFEEQAIGVVKAEFEGLRSTFDECMAKMMQTYTISLGERKAYAEDEESLDHLQHFVMATVGVSRDLREDIDELRQKLALLTMGHDEREMAAVLQLQRNFRRMRAQRESQGKREAIVTIQSCWRGHAARDELRQQHEAAATIQTAFRYKVLRSNEVAARKIQRAYRRSRAAAVVRGVGSRLTATATTSRDEAAALWSAIVDTSCGALFFCRLCGSPLDTVSPARRCGVCAFTEPGVFEKQAPTDDPSALQGEAAVQELAKQAIVASPNWLDALKNLTYFFVSCNRGFEGLGPDAARVDSLLAQHGLSAPEPWLPGLITAACEEMEARQHPFRKELWTTEVAQHPVADDL